MALWNKALSPEEIQWLYDEGAKREPIVDAINPNKGLQSVNIYSVDHRLYIKNVPFDVENLSVAVYTITGSLLYQTNHFRDGTCLNLNHGIYLVKVANHTISRVQKVLIR